MGLKYFSTSAKTFFASTSPATMISEACRTIHCIKGIIRAAISRPRSGMVTSNPRREIVTSHPSHRG